MYRHENGLTWQTSSYTNSGACVEVARPPGEVLVRDSKRRTGPRISLEPAAFAAMVDWAKTHQV
ncbi:DUF397 domain-containing protein [Streptomyces drozdowiczii]|uniref:DUF397 domain-containing protein n=1 Tax=Streptomyces drozdowiczii TaxID=202862 RepID=UPI00403CBD5D